MSLHRRFGAFIGRFILSACKGTIFFLHMQLLNKNIRSDRLKKRKCTPERECIVIYRGFFLNERRNNLEAVSHACC